MSRTGVMCWWSLPASFVLLIAPVPVWAEAEAEVLLGFIGLPFFLLSTCAFFYLAWTLFRWPIIVSSKLMAKVLLLFAVGFTLMGVAHFMVLYKGHVFTGVQDAAFDEPGSGILWYSVLLLSWVIIAIGLALILVAVLRQQLHNKATALSAKSSVDETGSDIDPLTSIWNRHCLFREGEALVDQLRSEGASVCLLSMDLDHFKVVNDTLGRATGDRALKQFCEVVTSSIRAGDRFARNGGEEFVLLMPRVTREEAYRIANRILISVERQPISFKGKPVHLTVSMGMVYREVADMKIEELLVAADKALYEAKESGRNRLNTVNITADLKNVVSFHNTD